MPIWMTALTLAAVIGAGLIGGVFFAFSTFVMQALAKLTPERGIEAMQWINKTVINPMFLGVFMGMAPFSIALAVLAIWQWGTPGMLYIVIGGGLYVLGCFMVTITGNVPLNNRLAAVDAASEEALPTWKLYLSRWVMFNHIRTIGSTLAALAFAMAL